jgi:hypothetical protein
VSVLESQTFFEVQIELLAVNPHSPADIPGFEPNSTQGIAISFYNYYNSILCFVNTRFTQTKSALFLLIIRIFHDRGLNLHYTFKDFVRFKLQARSNRDSTIYEIIKTASKRSGSPGKT